MKLALVFFVVAGLASYSNQQRLFRSGWMLNAPRRTPYFYLDPADTFMDSNSHLMRSGDIQGRRMSSSVTGSMIENNNPQNRLFGYLLYNFLKSSTSSSSTSTAPPTTSTIISTSTTTSFTTITSAATIATIQSCITSTLFAINNAGVYSTAVCSRRKRFGDIAYESIVIDPSQVLAIEASRIPRNYHELEEPEVISSLWNPEENADIVASRYLLNRPYHKSSTTSSSSSSSSSPSSTTSVTVVTATYTITNYSFTTVFLKKFFTPVAANAALICLPNGYTVC